MKFIVETDLGHDPDDFLTICHLVSAGHEIVAMSLVPGSPEQVNLAALIRRRLDQNFTIGAAKPGAKPENLGVHHSLMAEEGAVHTVPDGASAEILTPAFLKDPDADVLVIGPAMGLGKMVSSTRINSLTFQGGFLPYGLYRPSTVLTKFEGKESVGTFNFNGDRKAVDEILKADVGVRRFVGKNVCHTIVFDKTSYERLAPPRDEASRLYRRCVELYLKKHEDKKLHDPTALVCHLHPSIGTWFNGTPVRHKDGWTTIPGLNFVLADVNRETLWEHLLNWS